MQGDQWGDEEHSGTGQGDPPGALERESRPWLGLIYEL